MERMRNKDLENAWAVQGIRQEKCAKLEEENKKLKEVNKKLGEWVDKLTKDTFGVAEENKKLKEENEKLRIDREFEKGNTIFGM